MGWKRELERTDRELDKAIDAILQGVPPLKLKEKTEKLEARKAELACADESPPWLHPNMAAPSSRGLEQGDGRNVEVMWFPERASDTERHA